MSDFLVAPKGGEWRVEDGGGRENSCLNDENLRSTKTSCFAEKAARFFSREGRFFSREGHFFFCAGRTEMSQALGRFSEQPLGFINYSNIDVFAVQPKMNIANYLIFMLGATKMNSGAIKMLSVQPNRISVQPKNHSRAYRVRARTS